MLSVIWNKKRGSFEGSSEEKGLRILINFSENGKPSSKIIKPIFFSTQITNFSDHGDNSDSQYYCFLKSCHLCHKFLSLDKEVYMYRGEMGFCSLECRDRQIYLDEMEEIEISTKRILASLQQRRRDGAGRRCETSSLSEEFRQRRKTFPSHQKNPVIFSYS